MDLSIIIVNFNTKDLLRNCLASIFSQKGISFEVWVVDNASRDGSVEMIEKDFPQVKLIKNSENLGFARANNLVLRQIRQAHRRKAHDEFILLLNSDTVVSLGALGKMVQFLRENKEAGALGVKILNPDDSAQASVGKFYSLVNIFLMLLGGERIGFLRSSPSEVKEVDWVSGAALALRREILARAGFLDENFFMYMEEVEWCYRIKKAGFRILFYPGAEIIHHVRASGSKNEAIWGIYKGLIYFYQKHKSPWQFKILKIMLKTKAVLGWCLGRLLNNQYLTVTYGQAFRLV